MKIIVMVSSKLKIQVPINDWDWPKTMIIQDLKDCLVLSSSNLSSIVKNINNPIFIWTTKVTSTVLLSNWQEVVIIQDSKNSLELSKWFLYPHKPRTTIIQDSSWLWDSTQQFELLRTSILLNSTNLKRHKL